MRVKPPIPKNFLCKKGGKWREVKVRDLATLLLNVHMGARDEEVGFEDANNTLELLDKRMNRTVYLDPALIESALWSCNMMDEKKKFMDLRGRTFDEFVRDVLPADKFDRTYNFIKKKED